MEPSRVGRPCRGCAFGASCACSLAQHDRVPALSLTRIANQRAIIERRILAAAIADAVAEHGAERGRPRVVELLRHALEAGRAEIARRLAEKPGAGAECAAAQA